MLHHIKDVTLVVVRRNADVSESSREHTACPGIPQSDSSSEELGLRMPIVEHVVDYGLKFDPKHVYSACFARLVIRGKERTSKLLLLLTKHGHSLVTCVVWMCQRLRMEYCCWQSQTNWRQTP